MSSRPRLILTAGHSRALHVVALGELLIRRGYVVTEVVLVSNVSLRRIRSLVRQHGPDLLTFATKRVRSLVSNHGPLRRYMEESGIVCQSVPAWARARGVAVHRSGDLNSHATVEHIARLEPDVVIYGGGGILREPVLRAARCVINAHAGPLPEIRGMNAIEWSVLLGAPRAVTIHLIDRTIDTGAVLLRCPLTPVDSASVDDLREHAVVRGLQGILEVMDRNLWTADASSETTHTRQCFVMAPVVREILEQRLRDEYSRRTAAS